MVDTLSPDTDDLWFKVMAVPQDTPTRRADCDDSWVVELPGSQRNALWIDNRRRGLNDENLTRLASHYSLTAHNTLARPSHAVALLDL